MARELIIDNFAGGGGASTGIEWAMGRSPDIAINHNPEAVAMHKLNHPATKHYCEDVWQVDPAEATRGRPVGLAWFSPDCTKYTISDIGMCMLQPHELFRAQGFGDDVKLRGTKTSQVRLCGNSVSPPVAAAIVRANMFQQVGVAEAA